jgi:hypothetical protein
LATTKLNKTNKIFDPLIQPKDQRAQELVAQYHRIIRSKEWQEWDKYHNLNTSPVGGYEATATVDVSVAHLWNVIIHTEYIDPWFGQGGYGDIRQRNEDNKPLPERFGVGQSLGKTYGGHGRILIDYKPNKLMVFYENDAFISIALTHLDSNNTRFELRTFWGSGTLIAREEKPELSQALSGVAKFIAFLSKDKPREQQGDIDRLKKNIRSFGNLYYDLYNNCVPEGDDRWYIWDFGNANWILRFYEPSSMQIGGRIGAGEHVGYVHPNEKNVDHRDYQNRFYVHNFDTYREVYIKNIVINDGDRISPGDRVFLLSYQPPSEW